MRRNKFGKALALAGLLITVLAFGLIYYAFAVEPYMLTVETVVLEAEEADLSQDPLTIVQFSDTHFKADCPVENMEAVAQQINAQNPDLVIFTGDLYDNYSLYHDDQTLIEFLSMIQAPLGKLAIWGNHDYGGGAQNAYLQILDQSGFTLLQNSNWYIPLENGKTILFTGLDDALFGHPVVPEHNRIYDSDYDFLLLHEPDGYEQYAGGFYDLTLAGHTHGRQFGINLGSLYPIETQSAYWKGLYENEAGDLFVNSGIGTTHLSARFLMPPVLTVFQLYL